MPCTSIAVHDGSIAEAGIRSPLIIAAYED
jgi:hypothetical protein